MYVAITGHACSVAGTHFFPLCRIPFPLDIGNFCKLRKFISSQQYLPTFNIATLKSELNCLGLISWSRLVIAGFFDKTSLLFYLLFKVSDQLKDRCVIETFFCTVLCVMTAFELHLEIILIEPYENVNDQVSRIFLCITVPDL